MPRIADENLITIARASAFVDRGEHTYLPQTLEEREAFQPHGWVLKALRQTMAMAYEQGRLDQQVDAQRQTQ